MAIFSINKDYVTLPLYIPRGKIRIADQNGNQVGRPTECVFSNNFFIEWMITNKEIEDLIKIYLDNDDRKDLKENLQQIITFVKDSEFSKREASKGKFLNDFEHFKIYEYTETFYSYETINTNNIVIRVAFKMGDYIINPHLFVLIPFDHPSLLIKNNIKEKVTIGDKLGSGACGIWRITKSDIMDIIKTISHASSPHRGDMIRFIG